MPSFASSARADFERQAAKWEAAAIVMLERHYAADTAPTEPDCATKAAHRVGRLERGAAQLRAWLATHPDDRRGANGSVRKSNRMDNESAKMATSKGVIQGYTGVTAVDNAHQIIVRCPRAQDRFRQELLLPVVTAVHSLRSAETLIIADAGYHSKANLVQIAEMQIPALIADNEMHRRDERFARQERYTVLPDPPTEDTAVSNRPH